jgi:hypothetical protein
VFEAVLFINSCIGHLIKIFALYKKVNQICSYFDETKKYFFQKFFILPTLNWLLVVNSKQCVEGKVVVVSIMFCRENFRINKPCSDSCNNMSLWRVFFNINWTDRSTYSRSFPNRWSVISINYIELNINISIKLRCASVRGTYSDSITLTL